MNDRRPDELTRSTRLGQTMYVDQLEVIRWSSGNKLLKISGAVEAAALTGEVVKAYLAKYPLELIRGGVQRLNSIVSSAR